MNNQIIDVEKTIQIFDNSNFPLVIGMPMAVLISYGIAIDE